MNLSKLLQKPIANHDDREFVLEEHVVKLDASGPDGSALLGIKLVVVASSLELVDSRLSTAPRGIVRWHLHESTISTSHARGRRRKNKLRGAAATKET